MVSFCHISPTHHLRDFCKDQNTHLLLAHLVEDDPQYCQWYAGRRQTHQNDLYILDNSAFELYKAGQPMFPSEKLISLARKIDADYVVMSDYPDAPGKQTIEAAQDLAPKLIEADFKPMFVPQSQIGDIEDYIATFAWAASSPLINMIGISILGVPNAFGVEKDNKLQRFFSRYKMMRELENRGLLALAARNNKKIHFLGMVDGPAEIELCDRFDIFTWDSSAAVWAGLNGISFDNSPTGLIDGKFELEVDFDFVTDNISNIITARENCKYINKLAAHNLGHVNGQEVGDPRDIVKSIFFLGGPEGE